MLSGSIAITSRPIASNISIRSSTTSFGVLVKRISTFSASVGESPTMAQSIFDFAKGVGMKDPAWYFIAFASSLGSRRSISTMAEKTLLEGKLTATFLVLILELLTNWWI